VYHRFAKKVWLLAWLGFVGCGGVDEDQSGTTSPAARVGEDFSPVIARVGDLEITQGYFDYRYENLAPGEKVRYSGENWRNRFLDFLVDEALIYQQAEMEQFDRLPEIDYRLDMARRTILNKAYWDRKFRDELVVPEERIQEWYEQNRDSFRAQGRILGYHIECSSKERIDQAWSELQGGATFAEVAAKYSENEYSSGNGGLLGWFNPGGYIGGLGFDKEFSDFASELEVGSPHEPVKIGEHWHIVKIGSKTEGEQQSLEEVRERIVRTIRPGYQREAYEDRLRALKGQYPVRRFGEYQVEDQRTAEQLYRLAAETTDPHAKLHYYETLVEQYPEDERADEALFMVGFVSSEEFGDVPMAASAFRRLTREYPDSEYLDEAEWMMGNLGRAEPSLRGTALPEEAEEATRRIDALRQ
jgi:hypothetical protein